MSLPNILADLSNWFWGIKPPTPDPCLEKVEKHITGKNIQLSASDQNTLMTLKKLDTELSLYPQSCYGTKFMISLFLGMFGLVDGVETETMWKVTGGICSLLYSCYTIAMAIANDTSKTDYNRKLTAFCASVDRYGSK